MMKLSKTIAEKEFLPGDGKRAMREKSILPVVRKTARREKKTS